MGSKQRHGGGKSPEAPEFYDILDVVFKVKLL